MLQFGYRDELEKDFLTRQYEAVTRDALTECYNKKYFLDRLNSEHAFAERHGAFLAVAMLDVDHFKAVNDTYGHQAGDHALKGVADVMREQLRTEDVLARFGGEEFVLMMRNTNLDAAKVVAERIRCAVQAAAYRSGGQSISVTIAESSGRVRGKTRFTTWPSRSTRVFWKFQRAGPSRPPGRDVRNT